MLWIGRLIHFTNMDEAIKYWDGLYGEAVSACSRRGYALSTDFLLALPFDNQISIGIYMADKILEFGCGTGELCKCLRMIKGDGSKIHGVEISKNAVNYANVHNKVSGVTYECVDIIKRPPTEYYDLVISSNTLEHFKDPFSVIDRLLFYGKELLLLVPYNETLADGYDSEGGAGHVYSFTEHSFDRYNVVSWFTFFTHEWVSGKDPKQLAILLQKK